MRLGKILKGERISAYRLKIKYDPNFSTYCDIGD